MLIDRKGYSRLFSTTSVIGGIILIIYGAVAIFTTLRLQEASQANEIREIENNFSAHRQYVQDAIDRALIESRSLRSIALNMREAGEASRLLMNQVLKSNTENNQGFLGYWMVWEPDAFDGRDEVGIPGTNEEGRYVPYWHWQGDSVIVENCILYDESGYYQLPRNNHREYLLDPFYYPVAGEDSLLISVVVPIMEKGEFLGVAGVDISLNSLRNLVQEVSHIELGVAYLISGEGTYVVHPDRTKAGSKSSRTLEAAGGETSHAVKDEKIVFTSYIGVGQSIKPWVMVLDIPSSVINNNFISIRSNLLLLSGISALIIFFLIVYGRTQKLADEREKLEVKNLLLQADARLTSHIEGQMPSSIYSVDINFRYTGFNTLHRKEMKEVFNANVEVGAYMPDLVPEEVSPNLVRNFKRALQGEQFNVTSIFGDRYYKQTFNPVYDKDSQVIGLTSSIYEVTEKIMAEQELEKYRDQLEVLVDARTSELTRQKEFLQKLVDQIPALIFVRDQKGKYVLVNKLTADSFGASTESILGKTVRETHHSKKEAKIFEIEDRDIIENGSSYQNETLVNWPDGSKKWLLFTKNRMYIDEVPYIVGIHVDITHLKKTELELTATNDELKDTLEKLKSTQLRLIESEKMASLGALTAGLAHEINNPINYASGNVQPIRKDLQDIRRLISKALPNGKNTVSDQVDEIYGEVNGLLEGIEEGTNRVIGLIRDLNAFSGHHPSADGEEIDVNECIQSTVNLVRHQPGKKIDFVLSLDDSILIEGNQQQLKQVFLNMLTNSCHAIPKKGQVTIKTRKKRKTLVIDIADTGVGIELGNINHIFEPFFTTKEVGEGTGLGLAISYNIINDMGGHIQVLETSPEGTTFQIMLPLGLAK